MNIASFLEKFKHISAPDIVARKALIECIKKVNTLEVDKKNISFRNGIAYIKIKPVYKNEIFVHKQKILNLVREQLRSSDIKIVDIR